MAAVADFLASKQSGTASTAITACYVCSTFALTSPHVASRPPRFAQGDLKRDRRGPSVNAALFSLGLNSWAAEVQHIAASLGMPIHLGDGEVYDLTLASNTLLKNNRLSWHLESTIKP